MPEENKDGLCIISNNNKKGKLGSIIGGSSRGSTKFSTIKSSKSYNFLSNINSRLSTSTKYENIKDYYILTNTIIGEGGSSIVYGGYDIYNNSNKKKNNNIFDYAIKKVVKLNDKNINNQLINEIEINKILHNNNIIKCYDIFEDDFTIYFVYEYMPNGDLFDYIINKPKHHLDDNEITYFLEQILIALIYLHEKLHITHRDIKPENFMLKKEKNGKLIIKLMDFGTSDFNKKNGFTKTTQGTPVYIAPEVYLEKPYDSKVDMWALGVVLYNMATGRHPFNINNKYNEGMYRQSESSSLNYSSDESSVINDHKLIDEIINTEINFNVFKDTRLRYIATKLLEKNPNKRFSAVEALDELNIVKTFFSKKSNTGMESNKSKFDRSPVIYRQQVSIKSDLSLIEPQNILSNMTPAVHQLKFQRFAQKQQNEQNEENDLKIQKKSLFCEKNNNTQSPSKLLNDKFDNSEQNVANIKLFRIIDK